MILRILVHMEGEVYAPHSNAIDRTEKHGPNEKHEVLVIPLSDTCTQPWAMMIKSLNASSAKATMNGSRWSVDITFITILNPCYPTIQYVEVLIF